MQHNKAFYVATVGRRTCWCTPVDAASVEFAIISMLRKSGLPIKTLTADNGSEFADHESIARILKTAFYFAHPNSSWERGTNENANGSVRQYFPNGTDFSLITQTDLEWNG